MLIQFLDVGPESITKTIVNKDTVKPITAYPIICLLLVKVKDPDRSVDFACLDGMLDKVECHHIEGRLAMEDETSLCCRNDFLNCCLETNGDSGTKQAKISVSNGQRAIVGQ